MNVPDAVRMWSLQAFFFRKGLTKGGPVKEIDLSQSLPPQSTILTPDWSPDGKMIAFVLNQNKRNVLLYQNLIPKEKK
jgi:hypothetical protein